MIEVLKVTAHSGRLFFSKRHDVSQMMERVPSWQRIERVNMTEQQFRELPEKNSKAEILK
jgi:hypothetical protein